MKSSVKELCFVRYAVAADTEHAQTISNQIEIISSDPSNGMCKRPQELIIRKILDQTAIIAITNTNQWVGFCYLHKWKDNFVSTCALIVHSGFRNKGIALKLKEKSLQLAMEKYPNSKYFGLTTSGSVMKINSQLGYRPVTYSQVTQDEEFWKSCRGCSNFDILISKEKKHCLCTAMVK